MSADRTHLDELRARAQIAMADRDRLANTVVTESRPLTDSEMEQLVRIDLTIDAFANAINHQTPPAPPAPQSAVPANRSEPGSDYRLVAAALFELNKESYRTVTLLLADYGKWLVATIAAAHLGGIYFVGSITELTLKQKEPSLWALTIGLTLILSCGLATYYNWSANAAFYARRLNINYLIDPTQAPQDDLRQSARVQMTYQVAIGLGVASSACILIGAYLLSAVGMQSPGK